jgi:hypothetical protein
MRKTVSKIIFWHVPKTGGTSIRTALSKEDIDYVGHNKEFYSDEKDFIFSVYRDPFEIELSNYHYQKRLNKKKSRLTVKERLLNASKILYFMFGKGVQPFDYYFVNGELFPQDCILQFDDLHCEFLKLREHFGWKEMLPQKNKTEYEKKEHYLLKFIFIQRNLKVMREINKKFPENIPCTCGYECVVNNICLSCKNYQSFFDKLKILSKEKRFNG